MKILELLGLKRKEVSSEASALSSTRDEFANTIGSGMVDVKDVVAPPALEIDFDFLRVGDIYFRTLFVSGYPRFVGANWLAPIITFNHTLDISFYYYPVEARGVLGDLRRKIAEMEATITTDLEAGRVVDPAVKIALEDAQVLQEQLVAGIERFFQFSFYIAIPAETLEELTDITKQVESTLGSLLIITKHASLQQEQGFQSAIPTFNDKLLITRNMDTTSLATTFPFTSSELTANEGIMYGVNEHNGSLIIFDRFTLENANSVVFAKSGAGKSYLVKLEAMRSLMFGTEIIIIDPEDEYKTLCDTIGGEYIKFSYQSGTRINPFDLSGVYEEGENELGLKILSLHSLMRIILGTLTPLEDAVLDRALIATYKSRGITPDPSSQTREPPVLGDLYTALLNMAEPEARGMAERLEKFIKGSLSGIFDQQSTVNLRNTFTVFSIRDLQEELRPIAMFILLDYIWTKIKKDRKKRLLIIDEAWYLMRHPDSAAFMYSTAKRARKYLLGLTTISQDVEDFLSSDYGRAIVTNSSIQILLKQSPAAIDLVSDVFYLSEGERQLLLAADIGEGLFFAGSNHAAIRIQAASHEHEIITNPTQPQNINVPPQTTGNYEEPTEAPYPVSNETIAQDSTQPPNQVDQPTISTGSLPPAPSAESSGEQTSSQ